MYFDGTTLTALISDVEIATANAPAIAAASPRYTSPLAVIEAAVELPELGEAGVTAFLDAQGIELRNMPPGHRLITGALATEGDLTARLHAGCADYFETDVFVLSAGEPAGELSAGELSAGEPAGEPSAGEPAAPQAE